MSEELEATGYRWQNGVADLLRQLKPSLVVETGVFRGYSTIRFLQALADVGRGKLISIDPDLDPEKPIYCEPHPRWTLIRRYSHRALTEVYREHGPFDVFVHDSDHGAECMAYEFYMAWRLVRPGGYIISDDITWGGHGAWAAFVAEWGLNANKIGHAGVAQKPIDAAPPPPNDLLHRIDNNAAIHARTFAASRGERPRYFP